MVVYETANYETNHYHYHYNKNICRFICYERENPCTTLSTRTILGLVVSVNTVLEGLNEALSVGVNTVLEDINEALSVGVNTVLEGLNEVLLLWVNTVLEDPNEALSLWVNTVLVDGDAGEVLSQYPYKCDDNTLKQK